MMDVSSSMWPKYGSRAYSDYENPRCAGFFPEPYQDAKIYDKILCRMHDTSDAMSDTSDKLSECDMHSSDDFEDRASQEFSSIIDDWRSDYESHEFGTPDIVYARMLDHGNQVYGTPNVFYDCDIHSPIESLFSKSNDKQVDVDLRHYKPVSPSIWGKNENYDQLVSEKENLQLEIKDLKRKLWSEESKAQKSAELYQSHIRKQNDCVVTYERKLKDQEMVVENLRKNAQEKETFVKKFKKDEKLNILLVKEMHQKISVCERSEREMRKHQVKITDENYAALFRLNKEVKQLQEQNFDLKNQVVSLQHAGKRLDATNERNDASYIHSYCAQKIADILSEKDILTQNIHTLEREHQKTKREINAYILEKKSKDSESWSLEKDNVRLRNQLQEMDMKFAELQKKLQRSNVEKEEFEALKHKHLKHVTEQEHYNSKLKELNRQMANLQTYNSLLSLKENNLGNWSREKEVLETQNKKLVDDNDMFQRLQDGLRKSNEIKKCDQLEEKKEKDREKELEKVTRECACLKKQVSKSQEEVQKSEAKKMQSEKEVDSIRTMMTDLKRKNEKLIQEIKELQKTNSSVIDSRNEIIHQVRSENIRVKDELKNSNTKGEILAQEWNQVKSDYKLMEQMQRDLNEKDKQLNDLKLEHRDTKTHLKKQKIMVKDQENQNAILDKYKKEVEQMNELKAKENKKKLYEQNKLISHLENDIAQASLQVRVHQERQDILDAEIDELRDELLQARQDIAEKEELLKNQEMNARTQIATQKQLAKKRYTLEIQKLNNTIAAMQNENSLEHKAKENQTKEIHDKNRLINNLQIDLAQEKLAVTRYKDRQNKVETELRDQLSQTEQIKDEVSKRRIAEEEKSLRRKEENARTQIATQKQLAEEKHTVEMQHLKNEITRLQNESSSQQKAKESLEKRLGEQDKLLKKKEKAIKDNDAKEKLCELKYQEDINNHLREKKSLSNKVAQLNMEVSQMKETFEEESLKHKNENVALQNDLGHVQKGFSKVTKENASLRKESENIGLAELKIAQKAALEKEKKIQELSTRLATEMSTKISSDERSLENVSVKNRPMNIASEYEIICSNEWHDAKGALDEESPQISEEDRIKLLCSIFESSEVEATSHLNMVMAHIQSIISHPLEDLPTVSKLPLSTKSLPEQMKIFIGDCLRNNADTADIKKIVQIIKGQSRKKCPHVSTSVFEHSNFVRFLEASGRLAWKMVLQRPPMHFERKGLGEKWQGENKQEPFWSSSDPKDPLSRVKYYVHPALYHGESLMVKGRVYLSKS